MTKPAIKLTRQQDLKRLRKMALEAQGLLHAKPFGRGLAGAIKTVQHLGYVQIDTISVVERAHNHVLRSRVPNFEPLMIDQMLLNKAIFEYWSHAAAFLPIEDFRFSLPYKHAIRNGKVHWYKTPDRKLMKRLLERIRVEGALRSRDLEDAISKRTGWWDLKPTKKALEQLYMEGELMVSNREGFQKTYDLTERVLPSNIDCRLPTIEKFAQHLVDQQLRCHGLVALKGFTYLRKNPSLRQAVKTLINNRLNQQTLETVEVPSGQQFVMRAGSLDRSLPRLNNRIAILSPFDNSLIQRERLKDLFDFDYQIECYLPEAKREYGYFCLPLLFRAEFIGRMDCKAHRASRHLEIKSIHLTDQPFDEALLLPALVEAIQGFRDFQNCETASVKHSHPQSLAKDVNKAL